MNFYLILLSFLIAVINLYCGLYVIRINPKGSINRVFLFLASLFSIWALGVVFLMDAETVESVRFWYKFSAVGWIIIPSAALHFTILLTRSEKMPKYGWIYLLLYFPATIFLIRMFTESFLVSEFIQTRNGWIEVIEPNFWVWAFGIYSGILMLTTFLIILIWRTKISTRKEKLQFRIIFFTGIVAGICAMLMEIVLPAMKVISIPATGHISASIWVIGIWYAMIKYKLQVLTSDIIYQELINNMMDVMIMMTSDGHIINVNSRFEMVTGYKYKELENKKIFTLLQEKDLIQQMMQNSLSGIQPNRQEVNFIRRNNELIPFSIYVSQFRDKTGDMVGFMMLGHDIRDIKKMEDENIERKKMEVELRYAHHELGLKNRELEREKNKLKYRNDSMENELAMARKIQMELIPSESPISSLSFFYKPMEKIGGDFYDFIKFKMSNNIGIFVSDVSGHGVPAAFITTMMKAFMLQFGELLDNPAEFLVRLNEFMLNKTGGNFITAFYSIYDTVKHELTFANAGHISPILIENDTFSELTTEGRGVPLGVIPNHEIALLNKLYENKMVQLQTGSKLLIYTDGLTETGNIYDPSRLYEDERFYPTLDEIKHFGHKELINHLYQDLVDFRQSNYFEDDVCMVCLEIK